MGSALGATGWASGGVTGMRIAGGTKTAYDGAMGVVDIATDFIPGGRAFKNIGKIAKSAKAVAKKRGGKGNEGVGAEEVNGVGDNFN